MVDLVKYIVAELVDDKDSINITVNENVIKVTVAQKDMGKIIGKKGRIARAIRTVVKAASLKSDVKWTLDIIDADKSGASVAIADDED
ncbi:MAG: KH domain-containing protein [Firmicutes bacterium]|nr:KH domain-containing protein [Bacillota bacterium]